MFRPHDLLWLSQSAVLYYEGLLPNWVYHYWQFTLPVVVRRAKVENNFIPVGIRGGNRSQRLACKVLKKDIIRKISPEMLIEFGYDNFLNHNLIMQALSLLMNYKLPGQWGITGSCAYQLATGITVLTPQSDLDIVIRCPKPISFTTLTELAQFLKQCPCRIDTQIETLYGGFALNEWVRDKKVLLKTSLGPVITNNPWYDMKV